MTHKARFLNCIAITTVAFLVFGSSVRGQSATSFKVTGPCVSCGASYLEGLVMGMKGVSKASYDKENFLLSLQYDSGIASELDIQLELSLNGYDAGSFSHDANAALPACAYSGMTRGDEEALGLLEMEEDEDIIDWENPNNIAELEALGRRGDDDSDINDEILLGEDLDEDGEELMNWDSVDFEDLEELDDPDEGNP